MKISKFFRLVLFTSAFFIGLSCNKDDDMEVQDPSIITDINEFIQGLDYNLNTILNVQETSSGNSELTLLDSNTDSTAPDKGNYKLCETNDYKLDKNFDKISILRPTNGIIWPGALVYGDEDLLNGTPRPITLSRAPLNLRLDLPGMVEEGNLHVENPENSSVQTEINKGLEWWNANEYVDGYVNPSLSEYQSAISHSSKQMSLDIDMNIEWASSSIESQLDYESSSEIEVAAIAFKQVFYSVVMNTPSSPAAVFGLEVDANDVMSSMDESRPPAYVSSVDYGRIILFRMETEKVASHINLKTVLEYASGVSGGSVNAEFDEILNSSSTSITAITIGGNAEVASEAVTADGIASLSSIITGKNAVYSRDNPGVPIAYTIRFLKDNSLAKMGFTTDYTTEECSTKKWNNANITVKNKFTSANIQVKLTYKKNNGSNFETDWQLIKDETSQGESLEEIPDGAYDVNMYIETYWFGWNEWEERKLYHVSNNEDCWEAYYKSNGDKAFRKCP